MKQKFSFVADDDVAKRLQELKERGTTFSFVLNTALRHWFRLAKRLNLK